MAERVDQSVDPSEAFSLVASETRFAVLRALWDLTTGGDRSTASFAKLREASGIRDSGQFNYHLDKLRPRFVRKTEEGYELTHAGRSVLGAAVSGVYTDLDTEVEPQVVTDCPECGGSVEAEYRRGMVHVECTECELEVANSPVPPVAVAGAEPSELPTLYSRYLLTHVSRMNTGFCPQCGGRMDRSLDRNDDPDPGDPFAGHLGVGYECRECGMQSHGVVSMAAIGEPELVAFLHDGGVDLREVPPWELDLVFETTGTVASEDPIRVEATFELDDRALTLTFDESFEVVDAERHERPATGSGSCG